LSEPRIFLCHASEDKPRVQVLYHRLKEAGYHPWLDKEDLLPGQDWWEEIERIIRDRDNLIVVCLSCHSVTKKGMVQKEIERALDVLGEMPEGTIYLIPARLEDCRAPDRLSKLQWVNLFEPDGFDKLKQALDFELSKRRQPLHQSQPLPNAQAVHPTAQRRPLPKAPVARPTDSKLGRLFERLVRVAFTKPRDEQANASIGRAAWIVGILGCIGAILAVVVLWGLPLIEKRVSQGRPTMIVQAEATRVLQGRIVFVCDMRICVMNADGTGKTKLTDASIVADDPDWSPDGQRIALRVSFGDNWEICTMNADGTGMKRLTNSPEEDKQPRWSPSGEQILFVSKRDGNSEFYVMNADGTRPVNLTNNPATDSDPAWSPDGKRISFASDRSGQQEIYTMNADGTGVTRLTNEPAWDGEEAWSPDGHQIVFASQRAGNQEIYLMNADGTGVLRLTNNFTWDGQPAWSPDGRYIVFATARSWVYGSRDIYVMSSSGREEVDLIDGRSYNRWPDWTW
jgi:hypothetical protein